MARGVDTREILCVVVCDRSTAHPFCADGTGWGARPFRGVASPEWIPVVWYDDPRRRSLGGLRCLGHEADSITSGPQSGDGWIASNAKGL
jgi:hypothetical protein